MKKKKLPTWLWVLLAFAVLGALGQNLPEDPAPTPPSSTAQLEEDLGTPNILTESQIQIGDTFNGFGEKLDEFAFIEVKKADLAQITEDNYREFIDTVVSDPAYADYAYVRILCDDGTGIAFVGQGTIGIHYTRKQDDVLGETMGDSIADIVMQDDGSFTYEPKQ